MLTITFRKHLKQQLGIYEFIHCSSYLWDDKLHKVTVISGPRRRMLIHYVGFLLHTVYTIIMAINLTCNDQLSTAKRCSGVPFFGLQLISLIFRWDWKLRVHREPAQTLNAMYTFEETFLEGTTYKKTKADKLIGLFLPMVASSAVIIPTLLGILVINFPCVPPFIGSVLYFCRKDAEIIPPHCGLRLAIVAFEVVNSLIACSQGVFYLLFVFMSGVTCLSNYLDILQSKSEKVMCEDLEKIPKSERKKVVVQKYRNLLAFYRTIWIICGMFNDCARRRISPGLLAGNPAIQIFSCFVTIKLHDQIPMPGFAYFPIQFIDCCIMGIGIFTVASKPWTKSEKLIHSWQQENAKSIQSRYVRTSLKGLAKLRVMFGNSFVSELTPLVIQDFVVSQTVSMLLVT